MEKLNELGPVDADKIFVEGGSVIVTQFFDKVVEELQLDVTTPEGRKEIASRAYQLARVSTKYDDMGKAKGEELKKAAKVIDNERKAIRDHIEGLQVKVRKPLDEFEQREAARVQLIREQLDALKAYGVLTGEEDSATLSGRINAVNGFNFTDWQEFSDEAQNVKLAIIDGLTRKADAVRKQEEERAELERLRAAEAARQEKAAQEAAEKAKAAAEQRIKDEAAAKAKAEAEAAAAKEKAEAEAKAAAERAAAKAEADRLEAERLKAVRDKEEADARAAKAEADAKAAQEKAEADKKAAAEQAERDRLAAIEAERKRIADEQAEEDRKRKAREDDVNHRKAVNVAARAAVMEHAKLSEESATEVIKAIASGMVPSVKIFY